MLRRFVLFPVIALAAALAAMPATQNLLLRRLEARLGDATGLPLKIGSADIQFSPQPALSLHNIEIGSSDSGLEHLRVQIGQASVSGGLSVLFGADGELRASLSGANAWIPLADEIERAVESDSSTTSPIERVSSILARATGAAVEMGSGGGANLRAETTEITVRMGGKVEKERLRVELEAPNYVASFGFESSGRIADGAPMNFSLGPNGAAAAWATGAGRFTARAKRLELHDISGALDSAPFSGEAAIDLSGDPSATMDLRIRRLTIGALAVAAQPTSADSRGNNVNGFDFLAMDPKDFAFMPATAAIAVDELRVGALHLGEVKTRTRANGEAIEIDFDLLKFYQGLAKGRYSLKNKDGERAHQLSLSITRCRLSPLLADIANFTVMDGLATGHLDLRGFGVKPGDMLATAVGGRADVSVSDGIFKSAGLADLIDTPLVSDVIEADKGLLTTFRSFDGSFRIERGKAVSDDLRLVSRLVVAKGRGQADLAKGLIDFTFTPSLAAHGVGLRIPIRVFGPWKDPSVSADLANALDHPSEAVKSLEDVGAALFGSDGIDLDTIFPKNNQAGYGGNRGRKRNGK